MTKGDEMEVTSSQNGSPNFPPPPKLPKWATCVQCKLLPTTKQVVTLPCLHICCSNDCVNRLFVFDSPCCPECYQKMDRDMLNDCTYVNENIVEETETGDSSKPEKPEKCLQCVRDSPAVCWCIDCVEFLCSHCTEHHKFGKMTRSHTLAPTSEGIIELEDEVIEGAATDRKCSLHAKEDLEIFCETCRAALCSTCIASDKHSLHTTKTLEEVAKEFTKEFHSGVETLKTIQEKAEMAVKILDAKLKYILLDQKVYLHTEARTFFKRLIDALLQREITLRKDLVEATLYKAKEINIKKAKAFSLIKQCNQYIESARDIADKGTCWNILSHEHSIRKQYKELSAAYSILTEQDKFDDFVEKDYGFVLDELPIRMAENWISKICQPVYKNTKPKTNTTSTNSPEQQEDYETSMDVDEYCSPSKVAELTNNGDSPQQNQNNLNLSQVKETQLSISSTQTKQVQTPKKTSPKDNLTTRKSSRSSNQRYPLRRSEPSKNEEAIVKVEKTISRPDENFKTVTTRSSRSGKYKS